MVELDGHLLNLDDLWRVACRGEVCGLSERARAAMQESSSWVQNLAAQERAVYGINTGFGPLSGARVAPQDLEQHQMNLLHHLSTGQGALFGRCETRAIMVARANALARGYSGIRAEVVDLLLAALNKGILPEIPSEGSVGASGDLVPLAHMARLLVGLGHALVDGRRVAALSALHDAGLRPVTLKPKEGLALVNGTSAMTGLMALAAHEAGVLLSWMELQAACLFQVLFGAPEVLCEQLHRARGFHGQHLAAERIANHLRTHPEYARLIEQHAWGSQAKPVAAGKEIQDSYSLRCSPQILGAVQEALWHVEQVVERELNASTDNPLIFAHTGVIIHGGNFYGQQIAMVADYLRIGVIKMALLAERQLDRLMNDKYSLGLPPLLCGGEPGLNSGMAGCQLLATSLAAEARLLGTAASIQSIPTNANNQDVVSMGCIAAKMTRQAVALLWKIVAIQALALAQAADLRGRTHPHVMGSDYQKLHRLVRQVSSELKEDRPMFEDIAKVAELLQSEEAQGECLPKRPECPTRAGA